MLVGVNLEVLEHQLTLSENNVLVEARSESATLIGLNPRVVVD